MKRIGILTAGGDTPALNATLHGAVTRANQLRIEVFGIIKGFNGLLNPRVPHVHLNPLFSTIPELDAARGGTILGASRDYIASDDHNAVAEIGQRLGRLGIEGLICVGGDGTLNGMQPLSAYIPTVLAPKTIDNDMGLNYRAEPDEWIRQPRPDGKGFEYLRGPTRARFEPELMVNYVTPGYATAVFESASGVQRVRTTAESHRRIGIVEVMGRHSGYIALGAAYGQPDLVLVPEHPVDTALLVDWVKEIYEKQKHAVIVCAEGVVDGEGTLLGDTAASTDPAGNVALSGAAEALRQILMACIGDEFFTGKRRNESAASAIFTRKVGHTQRGGRPILFDRFYGAQLGGHAVDLLRDEIANGIAILQWDKIQGFHLDGIHANQLRDQWGRIHPRQMHRSFYDPTWMKPSQVGIDYLLPIFTNSIGQEDVEYVRQLLFDPGNLNRPYHSTNVDINKRIRFLEQGPPASMMIQSTELLAEVGA